MPPPVEDYNGGQEQLYPYSAEEQTSYAQNLNPSNDEARPDPKHPPGGAHLSFLDRLKALPEVRPIPWRPGQELPPERSTESPRVQQRGALLLVTRGQRVEPPCTHCANGYGRFTECITLENWFQGACSGCIFTSKGNKCSLRFQTSGAIDGRALRHHVSNPDMLKEILTTGANSNSSKKRKRKSAPAKAQASSLSNRNQQLESPQPKSPDMDTLLQAEITPDESSGHSDHAQQRQKTQKQQHNVSNHNPAYPYGAPKQPPAVTQQYNNVAGPSILRPTASQPPKQIWPVGTTADERPSFTPGSVAPSNNIKSSSTPIIDALPKAKQRHIYGLVSGLQGGIDHLQKQLNSVKASLGIEDDEDSIL